MLYIHVVSWVSLMLIVDFRIMYDKNSSLTLIMDTRSPRTSFSFSANSKQT